MTCMNPRQFQNAIVGPGLDLMAEVFDRPGLADDRAVAMLVAIALQESDDLQHRQQVPVPHAVGYWQFERGNETNPGGIYGVMTHKQVGPMMQRWAEVLSLRCEGYDGWLANSPDSLALYYYGIVEDNDLFALGLARLLLLTVPAALPDLLSQGEGEQQAEDEAWRQYAEVAWRPGKPHRKRWTRSVRLAREAWHGIES